LSNFRYRKFTNQAVDAIIEAGGWNAYQVVDRFYHGKTDDKSWDISREILDTGRLVLNENHRSEITFQDKTIADFVEIKKLKRKLQSLETMPSLRKR
jgi:hypothetical protein